jgi:hypothetical protein
VEGHAPRAAVLARAGRRAATWKNAAQVNNIQFRPTLFTSASTAFTIRREADGISASADENADLRITACNRAAYRVQ